ASAAEAEVLVGRMAGGPQAARPAEFEEVALRRGDRGADARRQRNAVQLADDGVLREGQPAADLGPRGPFLAQLSQLIDAFRRPSDDIHCFPRILWTPQPTSQHTVPPLWPDGKRYLHLVTARALSQITPVAQHLREIRWKPRFRAEARTPQPVEILF